jgi:hypothetical protein
MTTPATNTPNREQWLSIVTDALRAHFDFVGDPVPANVRATCGFPSTKALARKGRSVGECWADDASAGKVFEIFVSPLLDDALEVSAVLAHELVHATVGLKCGHKGPFKRLALAIGLEGKMSATTPGEKFRDWFKSQSFPPYPHERLNASNRPKTQTTRLIKCECPECDAWDTPYIARMSRATLEEMGAPICPTHRIPMVEG